MGMYTEIILGCSLKKETPDIVINALHWICGVSEMPDIMPEHEFFKEKNRRWVLSSSSYYFGVCEPVSKIWFDPIRRQWIVSGRGNIKNYNNEIEKFLDWLKPYIDSGSGRNEFYAIVCYEEQDEPTIYYLY